MLCQNCNKRPAKVHFTKIVNNSKVEMYLCEQCANEKSGLNINIGMPTDLNNLIAKFMGVPAEFPSFESVPRCTNCGMDFHEFQKTGKLGCSKCYAAFGERLKPLLKRIHGSVTHTGKVPARVSSTIETTREIERLQQLLQQAIIEEKYEDAAIIRDRIQELKSGRSNTGEAKSGGQFYE